jgi:hypothetical protein
LNREASAHYRDSTGITRSLTVVKSAMVGMDRDETVSSRVSTGINRKYTGLASALTVYIRAISGTEPEIHQGSVGDV